MGPTNSLRDEGSGAPSPHAELARTGGPAAAASRAISRAQCRVLAPAASTGGGLPSPLCFPGRPGRGDSLRQGRQAAALPGAGGTLLVQKRELHAELAPAAAARHLLPPCTGRKGGRVVATLSIALPLAALQFSSSCLVLLARLCR
jgi:hypothetical protein